MNTIPPTQVQTQTIDLPHGISLACRISGPVLGPRLIFLHGFPQGAFVWDELLVHFGAQGYRCIAPNLRGYAGSSAPDSPEAYRAKALCQDIVALLNATGKAPVAALIAHDWGGALAWNVAATHGALMQRFIAINSPHPAAFLKALQHNPVQQQASAYMHYLSRSDAEQGLRDNGYARLWPFLRDGDHGAADPDWLTPALREAHATVWDQGLRGPCAYYQQSPLKPPTLQDRSVMDVVLPDAITHVKVPTEVIWGERDRALQPCLLDGLDAYIQDLRIHRVSDASHWIVHEQPQTVMALIAAALAR